MITDVEAIWNKWKTLKKTENKNQIYTVSHDSWILMRKNQKENAKCGGPIIKSKNGKERDAKIGWKCRK